MDKIVSSSSSSSTKQSDECVYVVCIFVYVVYIHVVKYLKRKVEEEREREITEGTRVRRSFRPSSRDIRTS